MRYVVLSPDNRAQQIITEEDPTFPGIPIEERYSREFLSKCIKIQDDTEVILGYQWNAETETFEEPPVPEPVEIPETTTELEVAEELNATQLLNILLGVDTNE